MTDTEMLDWLGEDDTNLFDVRWRMINEGVTLREAVEWFKAQVESEPAKEDKP